MEKNRSFRKRKQPSSSDRFAGIFTRSKSQIYVHFNRSGPIRSDSTSSRKKLFPVHLSDQSCKKRRSLACSDTFDDDDISRISIKDLRARRVFSPSAITGNEIPASIADDKLSGSEKGQKFEGLSELQPGLGFSGQGLIVEMKNVGDKLKNSSGVNGSVEECVQTTQYSHISEVDDFEEREDKAEMGSQKRNENVPDKSSNGNPGGTKIGSTPKSVLVLNPCSQLKVFRSPSSFSYRRLLPFLMDIANDDSSASKNGKSPKQEKDLEKRSSPQSLASPIQDACGSECNFPNFKLESHYDNTDTLPSEGLKVQDVSVNENSLNEPSPKCTSKSLGIISLENQYEPQPGHAILDTPVKLKPVSGDGSSADETSQIPMSLFADSASIADNKLFESGEGQKFEGLSELQPGLGFADQGLVAEMQNAGDKLRDFSGVDGSEEECFQMTPDSDIISKDVAEERENRAEMGLQKRSENAPEKASNGGPGGKKNGLTPSSVLVLNPSSRLKVFKSPSLFSYRRLLPFLMEIANKESSASKNGKYSKEKDVEKKSSPQILPSPIQDAWSSGWHNLNIQLEGHDDSTPTDALPSERLNLQYVSVNDNSLNLPSPNCISKSLEIVSSENRYEPQLGLVNLDLPAEPKPVFDDGSSGDETSPLPAMSVSADSSLNFVSKEFVSDMSPCSAYSTGELKNSSGGLSIDYKPIDDVFLNEDRAHVGGSLHPEASVVDLTKGILKRNPKGCRGLCTCLNCASFRLHAERAFEFSKNQMQDAEEVAMDLIKELRYLRNVLEKSANVSSNHAPLQVNQVKEASDRVSKAEEIARSRLGQMFDDLNYHCKNKQCLQRPRVTFADYFEEKVISGAESPIKISKRR
ncbi:hypothetical protein RJ641_004743 [Dillenia turbinata]|uniref:Uncharacterized protein n=1 Tax=Dillenia turbinata TaxID=194707 RepID=A0AAN8VFB0_9MAGN